MRKYDRKLWEFSEPLPFATLPKWPCPYCDKGVLKMEAESYRFRTTPKSKVQGTGTDLFFAVCSFLTAIDQKDAGQARYWQCGQFNAFMRCGSCGQHVAVSGAAQEWNNRDVASSIIPAFFSPTLSIVPQRPFFPPYVQEELFNASAQYLIQPWLAGNSIRRLVERFASEVLGADCEYKRLHKKLEKLEAQSPAIGKALMSLKWLGNTASHKGEVEQADILDAFHILSYVLDDFYGRQAEERRVLALADTLTEKHVTKKLGTANNK